MQHTNLLEEHNAQAIPCIRLFWPFAHRSRVQLRCALQVVRRMPHRRLCQGFARCVIRVRDEKRNFE